MSGVTPFCIFPSLPQRPAHTPKRRSSPQSKVRPRRNRGASLWTAVSITALTQEVGFSQNPGASEKNVRGHALFYFPKSSSQVRPHPKAAIFAAVQSSPAAEPGRQPLDCGGHHRFDAGSGFLAKCRAFEKSARVLALFYFPKSSPKARPHPKAVIPTALQSSACGGTGASAFGLRWASPL